MLTQSLTYRGLPINLAFTSTEIVIHIELNCTLDYSQEFDYDKEGDFTTLYEILDKAIDDISEEDLIGFTRESV